MKTRKTLRIAVACLAPLALAGCDIRFIAGPKVVNGGEAVQYQVHVRPEAGGSASNATVFLTGYVPDGWDLQAASYSTSASGGASGSCTVFASDPGIITDLPAVPSGHQPVWLSAGPLNIIDSDGGTAQLDFIASSAAGNYTITFWAGVSTEPGPPGESFSLDISVLQPTPPDTIMADRFEDGTLGRWSDRVPIDPTIVAYYPLDGTADDISNFGNHGTKMGDPMPAVDRFGRSGRAMEFDGDEDQIIVPDSASLDLETGITVAAWIRHAGTGNQYIVGKINTAGGGFLYSLDYLGGTANGRFRDAQGGANSASGYWPVAADEWQLLVFTWDGDHVVTYLNGVVEGHLARTGTSIGTGDGQLEIGSFQDARYVGVIDDVLIVERALTFREIMNLLQ